MTNKKLAEEARERGYNYIFTIVKQHFNSSYYNINSVDDVIETGKFRPAPAYDGYVHGTITSELPKNGVTRILLRWMIANGK